MTIYSLIFSKKGSQMGTTSASWQGSKRGVTKIGEAGTVQKREEA